MASVSWSRAVAFVAAVAFVGSLGEAAPVAAASVPREASVCDKLATTSSVWGDLLWPLPPVRGIEAARNFGVVITSPRDGGRSFFVRIAETVDGKAVSRYFYYKVVNGTVKTRSGPTRGSARWDDRLDAFGPAAGLGMFSYRTGRGLYIDSCTY